MKLIIAIIQNTDSDAVSQALVEGKFRITRIASTGGFFRRGSTTFVIGVRDERLDLAIEGNPQKPISTGGCESEKGYPLCNTCRKLRTDLDQCWLCSWNSSTW